VRVAIAIAAALIVSCSAPASNTPPAEASPSPSPPTIPAAPRPTATEPPRGPVSAGAVSDAGLLFFVDYGDAPDRGQSVTQGLYRYDGASGGLTKIGEGGSIYGRIAHETAGGVYVHGENGRWDLLHWDGSRAGDKEFTSCQQEPGWAASWCSVSATGVGAGFGSHVGPGPGPFTGPWCPPAFIRVPGTARGTSFPPELCVQWADVSADGTQLLITDLAPDATPGVLVGERCKPGYVTVDGVSCYRRRLWIMPVGGEPRQLRLSPDLPDFFPAALSPDGRSATGVNTVGGLFFVDLQTGRTTSLGPARQTATRWSSGGGLAFVRGAAEDSWVDKSVVIVAPDGSTRAVRGANALPIGLAPAWDPGGRRLAWIASPAAAGADGAAQDYFAGKGAGDRRVLVSDLSSDPLEIRCGEGVAEGVRWSQDGAALLLLCRRPDTRVAAFDLWLHRIGTPGGAAVPIVRGITLGGVDPHGFAPDLFTHTAWSRAVAR
jgi:hypothetical protein